MGLKIVENDRKEYETLGQSELDVNQLLFISGQ